MEQLLLKDSRREIESISLESGGILPEQKLQWWDIKRMNVDEFMDLMTDLHWSKYTQVKIEVVQGLSGALKDSQ